MSSGVGRLLVIACCAVVAVSGCAGPGSTDPASTTPATDVSADSLIVSLDDVRLITGDNDLHSLPKFDLHQPRRADVDAPAPCRVVYDREAMFGTGWTQFRSVDYRNPGEGNVMIRDIVQAVAVYPDERAARTAFDRVNSELKACAALQVKDYKFTVDNQNLSTIVLNYSRTLHRIVRVKSSALIYVAVSFPQSERVARAVLQAIADRIN